MPLLDEAQRTRHAKELYDIGQLVNTSLTQLDRSKVRALDLKSAVDANPQYDAAIRAEVTAVLGDLRQQIQDYGAAF